MNLHMIYTYFKKISKNSDQNSQKQKTYEALWLSFGG